MSTNAASAALPRFKSDVIQSRFDAAYAALVQRWPVPYQELDVPTRFGTTHVIASGRPDAPALILMSCMMGMALAWRPNVAALSEHFRVYAVDVPGQPNRSVLTRPIRNRHEQADWFVDLLQALKTPRASIVGNSYGGFLALNQAAVTPDRVDRLVLISPVGGFANLSWRVVVRLLPMMVGLGGGTDTMMKATENGIPLDPDWVSLVNLATGGGRMNMKFAPMALSDKELSRVSAPTLLLIGDHELLYRPAEMLELARRRMPALTGEVVPHANHVAAMSNAPYVNRRMVQFLRGEQA